MQEYLMIGEVLKPQGIHGECKIKPYAADIERFAGWKTLYMQVSSGYTALPCRVTRIHDGFVYAVLGGCTNADDAEHLRARQLFIDRAHAAPAGKNAVYIADLIGCTAFDEDGHALGTLTDVLQYGTVDTWVFRTEKGTMMAPALLSVFTEVDPSSGRIAVCSEKLQEVAVFED